jgi:citrate synthase
MSDTDVATWLTAPAALARLGVARQTLYAYVSRGLLRTRSDPDDPRRSLYDPRGIDGLLERRVRGRKRQAVAASTINFGEPVLASRITRIADGRLWYRGKDAVALAEVATFEQAAALLWDMPAFPTLSSVTRPPSGLEPQSVADTPIARCLRAAAALAGPGMWSRNATALHRDAALLLRTVAAAAAGEQLDLPLHQALAGAWGVDAAAAELIRRALVLSADHELNASTFAVRVVASTGAGLPCCILAGLAALSGPLHGGQTERVRAFTAEPGMLQEPGTAVAARLARGERIPGYGHRLYPDGDPRAVALLAALDPGQAWTALNRAVLDQTGLHPTIDVALIALEQVLGLPIGAALAIFAIGRTAGWVAHALEQRQDGRLIRPRAAYVGP